MKLETDYARLQQLFYSIPVRDALDTPPVTAEELLARRRTVRVSSDDFINAGLMNGDPVALAGHLVDLMLVCGGTYAQLGMAPGIDTLLLAAKELVEDSRNALDKALKLKDWDAAARDTQRLQLVCAGLCYVLGLPYRELLDKAHDRLMSGTSITRAEVAEVLSAAGLNVQAELPKPPANDPATPEVA